MQHVNYVVAIMRVVAATRSLFTIDTIQLASVFTSLIRRSCAD